MSTPLVVDNVRAWLRDYDTNVMLQAARTSRVAAVSGHVALMPDAHVGKGATIGSVIPTVDAIIPAAVGVDLGCGVVAGKVRMTGQPSQVLRDLRIDDLPEDLTGLIDAWSRRIPAGLGNWFDDEKVRRAAGWERFVAQHGRPTLWDEDQRIAGRAAQQFGTLGSGNHFVELCVDEDDAVWIMLHSGSRGPGNRLAMHHIERAKGYMRQIGEHLEDADLAYVVQGTAEFDAYIRDLLWAQAFAASNRDAMLDAALDGLREVASPVMDVLGIGLAFDPAWLINNHHNYAALEEHGGRRVWITRKGAIRAREGDLGVIPGSMGTGSYIVRGLGNAESYQSASHGAGRRMSRRQAKKSFTEADLAAQMDGVTWQSQHAKGLLDEIPGAYKDLDDVMALQVDLVEPVTHLRTVVNYKGHEKGRW